MKNGLQVVRLNISAALSLRHMYDVTKISKRKLASYAVFLLREEFNKYINGESNIFGYSEEVYGVKSEND